MRIKGFAASAEEELADTVSIGEYLIRNKEATYLLEVDTDSLADEGIFSGDMVIFEKTLDYKKGDLVVILDHEGYHLAHHDVSLESEVSFKVEGVVVSTFRRYKK